MYKFLFFPSADARAAGYFFALLAIAAWGFNFVAARGLSDAIAPLSLTFLRWLVAACVMLPIGLPAIRRDWPLLRKHWRLVGLSAILGVALFNSFIYTAAATTPAANLSLIAAASPIFTLALAPTFTGEKVGPSQIAGALLAASGLLLLIGKGEPRLWLVADFSAGDLWMLAAAFIWASYTLTLRRKPQAVSMTAFHACCVTIGATVLLPFAAAEQIVFSSPPILWSAEIVGGILYLGLIASIFCYYCWNAAVSRVGAVRAGAIYYLLPIFAAAEAAFVLGEAILAFQVAGMALILGGVALASRR